MRRGLGEGSAAAEDLAAAACSREYVLWLWPAAPRRRAAAGEKYPSIMHLQLETDANKLPRG